MRRALTALFGAAALAAPVVDVAQAATKSKVTVVKKTVSGAETQVDRWGTIRVTLVVKKTTTVTGTKKKVSRSIVGVKVPVYPNHTDRSVYINQQALPYLVQETLHAQMNPNIQLISGATDTSDAFVQSLQSAILLAKKV
ncbi:MAG: hypothetical protein E6G08_17840 [Actinobacteria bacterium]|nr:MAG: hypothetical protein E6G08_17840 [Actinomycetota bacterium]